MLPPAAGVGRNSERHKAGELLQGLVAIVSGVNVHHHQDGFKAGRNPDVGARVSRLPAADYCWVFSGAIAAIGDQLAYGVLGGVRTIRVSTGTFSSFGPPDRKDRPAPGCVDQDRRQGGGILSLGFHIRLGHLCGIHQKRNIFINSSFSTKRQMSSGHILSFDGKQASINFPGWYAPVIEPLGNLIGFEPNYPRQLHVRDESPAAPEVNCRQGHPQGLS